MRPAYTLEINTLSIQYTPLWRVVKVFSDVFFGNFISVVAASLTPSEVSVDREENGDWDGVRCRAHRGAQERSSRLRLSIG